MCALRERVNAGVRSPGPVNARGSSGNALERAFEVILNGVAVRLALPAGERRAVVRDDESQASRLVGTPRCPESFWESARRADRTNGLITDHRSPVAFSCARLSK